MYNDVRSTVRVIVPTVYRPECPTIRSRLLPLCRELVPKGYNFEFLVIGEERVELEPGIIYCGYRNYPDLVYRILKTTNQTANLILACKAYSISGLLSLLVAHLKGIGYVLDVDDLTFPSEINKWWRFPLYVQEWLSERLLMLFKPITTVASHALADYWGKHTVYIPNSADSEKFSRKGWNSDFIRERYRLEEQVVIWPAVFFQETDRRYVLEIFQSVKSLHSKIKLLVIGDGEYLPEIKERAAAMNLGNIVFVGRVPYEDMPHYYASATAGLLPLRNNLYDACKGPIKLFEYMAMELPVIATDIGEPREIIRKADCGILLPFDEPQKAADMIIQLLQSSERLMACGKNGRKYIEEQLSFVSHAEKLRGVFESAGMAFKHSRRGAL